MDSSHCPCVNTFPDTQSKVWDAMSAGDAAADANAALASSRLQSSSSSTAIVPPTFIVTEEVPATSTAEDDTYALDGQTEYPQTEEQRLETRHVEDYLRNMSKKERLRRARSEHHASAASAGGGGGAALVRRISTSLSRVQSLRHSHQSLARGGAGGAGGTGGAYEMTQSHYAARPENHHQQPSHGRLADHSSRGTAHAYGRLEDESDELHAIATHIPEASDSRQELHDRTPLRTETYATGDLSTISLEDLNEARPTRADSVISMSPPPESDVSTPTSPPLRPGTEAALARLRAQNFPSVTVGGASRKELQRQASARSTQQRLRLDTHNAGAIQPIPEGDADTDVTMIPSSESTSVSKKDDPFQSVSSSASLDRTPTSDWQDLPLQTHAYPSGTLMSARGTPRDVEDAALTSQANRWYWSDLLLGCGLCGSGDDDDEQAARTNPME